MTTCARVPDFHSPLLICFSGPILEVAPNSGEFSGLLTSTTSASCSVQEGLLLVLVLLLFLLPAGDGVQEFFVLGILGAHLGGVVAVLVDFRLVHDLVVVGVDVVMREVVVVAAGAEGGHAGDHDLVVSREVLLDRGGLRGVGVGWGGRWVHVDLVRFVLEGGSTHRGVLVDRGRGR